MGSWKLYISATIVIIDVYLKCMNTGDTWKLINSWIAWRLLEITLKDESVS